MILAGLDLLVWFQTTSSRSIPVDFPSGRIEFHFAHQFGFPIRVEWISVSRYDVSHILSTILFNLPFHAVAFAAVANVCEWRIRRSTV